MAKVIKNSVAYNKDTSNSVTSANINGIYIYNYGSQKSEIIACKHCGWRSRLFDGKSPAICEACMHEPVTGEVMDPNEFFHNELGDDSVKPTTHVQVKWICKECGHYGLKWISKKKKYKTFQCPECSSKRMRIRGMPEKGRSKSLWGNVNTVIVENNKNNAMYCGNCHNHMQFKFVRPRICKHCGHEFPSETTE